jgi:hypothetical protein
VRGRQFDRPLISYRQYRWPLARVAAEAPGSRVLNIADPLPPTVAEIAALIARHLDYSGQIVEVDEEIYPPTIGRTPWSIPHPFVVDCQSALHLGYSPMTTYANAVKSTCDWLVATASDGDWKERFPVLATYPRNLFDYDAADTFFGTTQSRINRKSGNVSLDVPRR